MDSMSLEKTSCNLQVRAEDTNNLKQSITASVITVLTTASWRERHPERGKRWREREGLVCENGHIEHQENDSNV